MMWTASDRYNLVISHFFVYERKGGMKSHGTYIVISLSDLLPLTIRSNSLKTFTSPLPSRFGHTEPKTFILSLHSLKVMTS